MRGDPQPPNRGDTTPPLEPAAQSSRRPGPSKATTQHLRPEGHGAAPSPRPPGTRLMHPRRWKTTCSKRWGRTQPPEGPTDNTAQASESHRDDFTPKLPEPRGEAKAAKESCPTRLQIQRLTTRKSARAAEARTLHVHRLGLTMRPGGRHVLQHTSRRNRRPAASPSPPTPSQAV
ncbi:hypothetical protein NDU88_005514 [Pleurodeles waltl]|uniref:Uncharacterized protein n=1 Tax=Pleurodeles waltl TaxID=8319 RepID=A0AAV7RKD3_PLEWA|nr:hypothetical protein NDU88_005514 [Pleurodeles waltl]